MLNAMNNKQKGATLVVSLVILAIITVLGIASIRSSNLELKMAASARDRAIAMQMADSGISAVQKLIGGLNLDINSYLAGCVPNAVAGEFCFQNDANCQNTGLCFTGTFVRSALNQYDCQLQGVNPNFTQESWRNRAYWQRPATPTVTVLVDSEDPDNAGNQLTADVQYMVEFMCFGPRDTTTTDQTNTGAPIYRITTRAAGPANRSTVMLQSVFIAGQ